MRLGHLGTYCLPILSARSFAEKERVEVVFEKMEQRLMAEMPEDPVSFLHEMISKEDFQALSETTPY